MSTQSTKKTKKDPLLHLIAGGTAGLVESSICHPLDTIKTRAQLRKQQQTVESTVIKMRNSLMEPAMRLKHSMREPITFFKGGGVHEPRLHLGRSSQVVSTIHVMTQSKAALAGAVQAPLGPIGTAKRIIQREGFFSLYKGLSAVISGIVPKMAVRFLSFEQYRDGLRPFLGSGGSNNNVVTFTAGLLSGLTEAILVVTPAEVCKIRMQSQYHSMLDPAQIQQSKYRGVLQTACTIVREEGVAALYKGLVPTMLRQGCNQAVNFTAYHAIKRKVMEWQRTDHLEHWQSLIIGGVSGGMGPLVNNPLDVTKTRLQRQIFTPGKPLKYTGLAQACAVIYREEGTLALWKGITPRLLRIVPGQAITFTVYESVASRDRKSVV